MVLMVDGSLSGSPLSVGVREGWVLGQDSCHIPEEQVWVVDQSLGVNTVVVHHNRSVVLETSTETSYNEVDDPTVSQPGSNVEILNGELSDEEESEQASKLSSASVVSPVEVRSENGSGNNIVHLVSREPTSQL